MKQRCTPEVPFRSGFRCVRRGLRWIPTHSVNQVFDIKMLNKKWFPVCCRHLWNTLYSPEPISDSRNPGDNTSATPGTTPKHYTSSQLPQSQRVTCHPHVLPLKAELQLARLQPHLSIAVTNCLLVASHFTDRSRWDGSLCQAWECGVQEVEPGPLASEASVLLLGHLHPPSRAREAMTLTNSAISCYFLPKLPPQQKFENWTPLIS